MARGFESKDVEYQQSEAERIRELRPGLSREQSAARDRRVTIELALARARAELTAAQTTAHQRMLTSAITALEQQLAALD